ncbi:hypothetical protein [Methylobacterium nigriterrae]|uniref:hypothetical protein n=1 Tax=Methylobacterium nigriterrae TaxID=3127512 RepID=UPI0030140076
MVRLPSSYALSKIPPGDQKTLLRSLAGQLRDDLDAAAQSAEEARRRVRLAELQQARLSRRLATLQTMSRAAGISL